MAISNMSLHRNMINLCDKPAHVEFLFVNYKCSDLDTWTFF